MNTQQEQVATRQGARGRILVVDDDRDVLGIVSEILRSLGYDVIETSRPEEAIAAAGDRPIDLLLTDVRMPGMNGYYLARVLWATRPDLQVLFMTGYGGDLLHEAETLEPRPEILEKPFSLDELSARVEALMGAPLELVH